MPERRRSPEIESLVEELIERLTEAVEAATSARARVLTDDYLLAAKAEAPAAVPVRASPTARAPPSPPERARPVRPKRPPPTTVAEPKAPPAVDADEERRTVELARLRSILRPTVPTPPEPSVIASPPLAPEDDSLQALEDQIRARLPSLPGLSESRYTAQIAAWVGRVRLIQSGPDGERTRIASRIMFDKLRNLAWSMEAGPIEGLNLSWSTRNWERYIEENETIAAAPDVLPPPPPTPEPDAEVDVWATPDETDAQA